MKPDRDITDPQVARALAHPLRVRILALLSERTASPRELALELDADLSLVSYHVRTLHRIGLLDLVRRRRRRAAVETYYRASERPVVTSEAWAKMPRIVKDQVAASALAQISEQVNAAAEHGGFRRDQAHASRSPMVLDDQAFAEVAGKLDALLAELPRIAAAAEKRLRRKNHEGAIPATAVLMLFETAGVTAVSSPSGGAGDRVGRASAPRVTSP
jgi:DNA-binding transcriptional ArsR family regulator